jgi:hypothetical protein
VITGDLSNSLHLTPHFTNTETKNKRSELLIALRSRLVKVCFFKQSYFTVNDRKDFWEVLCKINISDYYTFL